MLGAPKTSSRIRCLGLQDGSGDFQLLTFDPDFKEYCKPDSLEDVKLECEVKLAVQG